MSEAKKTPLYEQHAAAKGNFIDYGGWFLPVTYQGIVEEVLHTRKKVSLFDASHMGEILVEGQKAEEFLQGVLTNDLSVLKNNGVMYSPICYPHGGTVDDILVYRYAQDRFLLVTNAVNTEKDYNFLKERYPESVVLEDLSAEFALIAIQGPLSLEILKKTMTEDVLPSSIRRYNFLPDVKIAGIKCLLSRTGYTGEDGFEILCSPNEAASLWEALIAAGRSDDGLDVQPAGLGARDLLRLEASLPLYGQELSPEISPLQAGLDRFVALEKKIAFTGQDALLKQKEEGLKKRLVGLVMLERGIPRSGYIIKKNQQDIGWISSGTFSPTLQKALGLAFVDSDKAEKGTEVKVVIRNKEYPARIEKLPFYRRES